MSDDLSRRSFIGLLGATSGALLAGCSSAPQRQQQTRTEPDTDFDLGTPQETQTDPGNAVDGERFVRVFKATRNAVVQIQVIGFDGAVSSGTGWLVDQNNHIVTNEHVVAGAEEVFVRFRTSGWLEADIVGTDVYSDLAVVGVDRRPSAADPLALVTSDPPIGTEVLAIGNPFGLSGSVSSGIVSGVNRTLPAPSSFSIPDAIQTDAPVNPGNSGGPLVDLDGEVIGVINSGGGDNIGFAISGALTDRVVPALIEDGNYEHSYLGIRLNGVTPAIAAANGLDTASGIYVHEVTSNAPAEGVLQGSTGTEFVFDREVFVGGDVIKRIDGTPIPTEQALSSFLALQTRPGQTVEIEIIRDGQRRTVEMTIGSRPQPP